MKKEDLQIVAFQMISYAGEAVAAYVEALKLFRAGQIEESRKKYELGNEEILYLTIHISRITKNIPEEE